MSVEVPALKVIFVLDIVKIPPFVLTPKVNVDEPRLIARVNEPVDKKAPQLMA